MALCYKEEGENFALAETMLCPSFFASSSSRRSPESEVVSSRGRTMDENAL